SENVARRGMRTPDTRLTPTGSGARGGNLTSIGITCAHSSARSVGRPSFLNRILFRGNYGDAVSCHRNFRHLLVLVSSIARRTMASTCRRFSDIERIVGHSGGFCQPFPQLLSSNSSNASQAPFSLSLRS